MTLSIDLDALICVSGRFAMIPQRKPRLNLDRVHRSDSLDAVLLCVTEKTPQASTTRKWGKGYGVGYHAT